MPFYCRLCPRSCGSLRTPETGGGVCGQGLTARVARAAPHMWEEPPISGERGSGAVFFTGCALKCVYCQNYALSRGEMGAPVSPEKLREIYLRLVGRGVHNINLVTAGHFLPAVLESLREPLPVPVVWNSSGYETVEQVRSLKGKVQVYLPDMKYMDAALARRYSAAPDYPETAKRAVLEMFRQTGPYVMGEDGLLRSGVMIRHLVLPGALENTRRVIDWVAGTFDAGDVLFSLMSQYTPMGRACDYPELDRRLTEDEYRQALGYMEERGIVDGFYQELDSAGEEYTPDFDLTGVEG